MAESISIRPGDGLILLVLTVLTNKKKIQNRPLHMFVSLNLFLSLSTKGYDHKLD